KELTAEGRLLEAQRLEQRTNFDLEMIAATGSCAGIENYSRFLTGRLPGEPPPTLFEYLPDNALLFIDESHQTVPQIGAIARGDQAGRRPDRRSRQRSEADSEEGLSHVGHDADQAHGGGPDRISPRSGAQGPLHALGRRDLGTYRAHS